MPPGEQLFFYARPEGGPLAVSRLWAVWNEPSSSGRSRQGELMWYFHAMASSVPR